MGEQVPNIRRNLKREKKSLRHNSIGLLVTGGILLFCALLWRDVVEYIDGEPQLKGKYREKLEEIKNEPDAAEQYALIAEMDGYYPCLHSGRTIYYLREGEVWKYGVTAKGEKGRYPFSFYSHNKVYYLVQFRGSLHECLKEEQRKLLLYPLLPENLSRLESDRLIRPPYNPINR